MAFVLYQHLNSKGKIRKIEYPSIVMETVDNKMTYFFETEKKKLPHLLRINYA
jgi:hypothetical protein